MAHAVQDQRDSPSNRLRAALDDAEKTILRLNGTNVEGFLLGMDLIAEELDRLEAGGLELRGERARHESLLSRLQGQPQLATKAAAHAGGLEALRRKNPPAAGEWWHLDAVEAQQRRDTVRRLLTSLGVLAGILLGVYVLLTYVFPPDPNAVLSSNATGRLPDLAAAGEWEAADALIAETLAQMTEEDVQLRIWQSVVAEKLGRQEEAEAAFALAQAQVPDDEQSVFWSMVGNTRVAAGDLVGAVAAADQALALNPEEAQAYFVLATVAEMNGNVPEALDNFDKAFAFASISNPQLAVMARVRMGMLLQSAPQSAPMTNTVPAGQ